MRRVAVLTDFRERSWATPPSALICIYIAFHVVEIVELGLTDE